MNKTCPLCGTVLIPRYYFPIIDGLKNLKRVFICPFCIPPDPPHNDTYTEAPQ